MERDEGSVTEYLYDRLKHYSESDYYGFHMPGHKRNAELTGAKLPYFLDITEIDGFDDLHHARGILREAQKRAVKIFHSEESRYLINGSTVGILSAVLGSTRRGDKIAMARNCHKSVYNAVWINALEPVYLYPESTGKTGMNGAILLSEVERVLTEHPDVNAVVITSPTYDGVVSEVGEIARFVRERGGVLIVDEAHGAHLGFHPDFPPNSNQMGADLVIQSLHKTLPALTQTAILHMNGKTVDRERVDRYLHMLQSSSPSYVLMAGLDECVRILEENGAVLFDRYAARLREMRERLGELRNLQLIREQNMEPSKIVISTAGCAAAFHEDGTRISGEHIFDITPGLKIEKFTGKCLYNILSENYRIQMEMAAPDYVVGITSPADTAEGMERLVNALLDIDRWLFPQKRGMQSDLDAGEVLKDPNERVYLPFEVEEEAQKVGWESIPLGESAGKVTLEYGYVYPPGIPLCVPGERISSGTAKLFRRYEGAGFCIEGIKVPGMIEVLCEKRKREERGKV